MITLTANATDNLGVTKVEFYCESSLLLGADTTAPHEALYWRFGPQKAIRKGKWKLVDWRDFETKQESGWQLYDQWAAGGRMVDPKKTL
jgi:arylsulfatase A-like enzyme